MNTVIVKPNGKRQQYGSVENLSAVELPIWLLMFAKLVENPIIIDAEAENLTASEVFLRIRDMQVIQVHILPIGSHPSAHIQQLDEARLIKTCLTQTNTLSEESVIVHEYLPFNPCEMGTPDWKLLDISKYRAHNWHCWGKAFREPYASVFTSVSCPYNCEFCCVKSFYRQNYTLRPVEHVISDFRTLYTDYGVKNFKIMDELFAVKGKRVSQIADGLQDVAKDLNIWTYARIDTVDEQVLKDLRRMGVTWLAYGIESGSDAIRKSVMKGSFDKRKVRDIIKMTRDIGIHIVGNYMFGFADDNMETMQETLDFAKELKCEYSNFYCTVAYPGSKLYDNLVKEGRSYLFPDSNEGYAQMSKNFKPLATKHLAWQDVLKFRDKAFTEYHKDKDYIKHMSKTFGCKVVKEIKEMNKIKIERDYAETKMDSNIRVDTKV